MPSFYRPSGNGCAERVPILGVTFFQIATTDKSGAINASNFSCLGLFFPRNYYSSLSIICTQVYQMVAALTRVTWWFDQFPSIVRRTPHPELGPTCEFRLCHAFTTSRRRPASTLTSAPGHENDPARLYPLASPRLDGGLRQHFITPCRGLRNHSAGLH